MASRNKNADTSRDQHLLTKHSTIFWIIASGLLFFFLFMPFQKGLLNSGDPQYEAAILYSFLIGAVLLIGLAIHSYKARSASIVETPYQYLIWCIPLLYLISMLGAVSAHYSYIEFLIWILYAILFTTAYRFTRNQDGGKIAFYIFMGSAAVIVLFGIMNWFGDASLWGLLPWVVYGDAAWNSGIDIRLASVFQYANSFAAYLIAFSFACLATIVYSKHKQMVLFASFMFVPTFVSFILTYSRGGWLAFPIILLLILPLLTFSKQIQMLFHLVIGAAASIVLLPTVTNLGLLLQQDHTQGTALKAWAILIGISLIAGVISLLFNKYAAFRLEQKLQGWNKKKMINLLLPCLAIVAGVAGIIVLFGNTGFIKLLPESIGSRLETINFNQHSVLERGTFYMDAIAIWKDYPIFGAGGGAWQALYQQYQGNPYTSSQVHSFFLQMLVEVGIVGILALFIILITVYYYFLQSFAKKADEDKLIPSIWYIVVTSILLHSALDFNMSYVYLGALVFFSLGGMLASSDTKTFDWQQKLLRSNWKLATPVILIVISLAFGIATFVNISGHNAYNAAQASLNEKPVQQTLEKLNTAINRGGHPEYIDYKLQLLNQLYEKTYEEQYAIEAQQVLDKGIKSEPYYEKFIYRQIELNTLLKKDDSSVTVLENAVEKFPWEIDYYVELARTQFRRSIAALEQDDPQSAKQHLQFIIDLRDEVLAKAVELENLPDAQLQGRAFGLTAKLAMPIGQALFVFGDYEQAESYLALAWNPTFTDKQDTMAALYYSAALQKLNRPSEEVNAIIFAAFPDKQDEFMTVLNGLLAAPPINN